MKRTLSGNYGSITTFTATCSLSSTKNKSTFTLGGDYFNRFDNKHYGKVIWAEVGIPKDHRWYNLDASKTDANVYANFSKHYCPDWKALQTFSSGALLMILMDSEITLAGN
jgi:hypothetical protein